MNLRHWTSAVASIGVSGFLISERQLGQKAR
jgi:hypothetical protein